MVRLLKYVLSEYELTEYELIKNRVRLIRVRINRVRINRVRLIRVRFNTFCPFGKNNLVRLIRLYVLTEYVLTESFIMD